VLAYNARCEAAMLPPDEDEPEGSVLRDLPGLGLL
jgi:hypothetical protein